MGLVPIASSFLASPWRSLASASDTAAPEKQSTPLGVGFHRTSLDLSVTKWRVMSIIQVRTSNIPPLTLGSNNFPSRTLAQRPYKMGSPTLAMRPFDLVVLGRAKGSHESIYSVLLAQRQNSAACWFLSGR
jgi:hypothetical protein